MNVNILVGRIASEPKKNQNGTTIEFRVAVSRGYVKEGYQDTDFLNVRFVGENNVNNIEKYFKKGDGICVIGENRADQYEKDGEARVYNYVFGNRWEFVPANKNDKKGATIEGTDLIGQAIADHFKDIENDDMPF